MPTVVATTMILGLKTRAILESVRTYCRTSASFCQVGRTLPRVNHHQKKTSSWRMTGTFPDVGRRLPQNGGAGVLLNVEVSTRSVGINAIHRSPPIGRPESILSLSGCCSAENITCLCPFLPVADVAVHLTPIGHHHAACGEAGVLRGRGFPVESRSTGVQGRWRQSVNQRHGHGGPIS